MADSKYVRLADRLSGQVIVDLASGWSIAGLDVKEVPEEGPARGAVRRWVQTGVLEPASRAEFDEVKKVSETDNSEEQEHVVQAAGEQTRAKIRESRAKNPADAEIEDDTLFDPPPPVAADGMPERLSVEASTVESTSKRGGRRG